MEADPNAWVEAVKTICSTASVIAIFYILFR